jgi:hypothetical protein
LFGFVIDTHDDLAESPSINFSDDFIPICHVISDNDFVSTSISLEAKVIIGMIHAIASVIQ